MKISDYAPRDRAMLKMLGQQLKFKLQQEFCHDGPNDKLRAECDEIAAKIRAIHAKYERGQAA